MSSAFKLSVSKCTFYIDSGNERDSKSSRLNLGNKKLALLMQKCATDVLKEVSM